MCIIGKSKVIYKLYYLMQKITFKLHNLKDFFFQTSHYKSYLFFHKPYFHINGNT